MMIGGLREGWQLSSRAATGGKSQPLYNRYEQAAKPTRQKLVDMVPADELFARGISLMETNGEGSHRDRRRAAGRVVSSQG